MVCWCRDASATYPQWVMNWISTSSVNTRGFLSSCTYVTLYFFLLSSGWTGGEQFTNDGYYQWWIHPFFWKPRTHTVSSTFDKFSLDWFRFCYFSSWRFFSFLGREFPPDALVSISSGERQEKEHRSRKYEKSPFSSWVVWLTHKTVLLARALIGTPSRCLQFSDFPLY